MAAPDAAMRGQRPLTAPMRSERMRVSGWGGDRDAVATVLRPEGEEHLSAAIELSRARRDDGGRGAIARGMGRSYGDAAQLDGGIVLDVTQLGGIDLDRERRTVTAGAGVTLGHLMHVLGSAGWIVPVLPGTQHVTVGGAIASDIHGKNHAAAGTFGSHVERLGLMTAGGQLLELAPDCDGELFRATLGGMGLTGVIVWATIKVRQVSGPWLAVDSDRVDGLDDALAALLAPGGDYRVAWLDLLCSRPGRGIVTRADHITDSPAVPSQRGEVTVTAKAGVPGRWPGGLLRASTVRAFNELRFRRGPRHRRGRVEAIGPYMFPLDALDAWPRLYGRSGFVQYQLAVPSTADRVLHEVIARTRRRRVPCYLAVLKDLGAANDAPLSFPMAGWALALDFPRAAAGLDALLDDFDELVAAAGGRVYLTKDARMRRDALEAMYPRLTQWRRVRDRADPERLWQSDLALRTGLIGDPC